MTVAELGSRMDARELAEWAALARLDHNEGQRAELARDAERSLAAQQRARRR
jgi:hypothetical protein